MYLVPSQTEYSVMSYKGSPFNEENESEQLKRWTYKSAIMASMSIGIKLLVFMRTFKIPFSLPLTSHAHSSSSVASTSLVFLAHISTFLDSLVTKGILPTEWFCSSCPFHSMQASLEILTSSFSNLYRLNILRFS